MSKWLDSDLITCLECIKRVYPDNPQVRSGKYNLCGCDYCSKPSYYRQIEQSLVLTPVPERTEPEWQKNQWQYVQQLRAQVNHLNAKVTEMRAEKKKKSAY